ncbi:MAG TPA: hypothetical protein VGI66_03740 [Streptosporangiaceae bacterium]|jgi:hypothetical protein
MVERRTVLGHSVPFIAYLLFWLVVIVLLIFIAGAIIHATHVGTVGFHLDVGYFHWFIGFD